MSQILPDKWAADYQMRFLPSGITEQKKKKSATWVFRERLTDHITFKSMKYKASFLLHCPEPYYFWRYIVSERSEGQGKVSGKTRMRTYEKNSDKGILKCSWKTEPNSKFILKAHNFEIHSNFFITYFS